MRLVLRPQRVYWILRDDRRRRDLRQGPAVRTSESQRAVLLSIHLVAVFVHCAVVPATQQREV